MRTVNSIPLDEWVHVAGVWESPTLGNIYINGIPEPFNYTGSGLFTIVDGPISGISTVGYTNTVSPEAYMKGIVDEVRIWNTARSLTEIRENMCKLIDPTNPDLAAYYQFEDGVGTSLTDVSGNGHNGSFVGTPTWVTSAAPLGDESVYTYPGLWAGASLSYGLPGGESVLVDTVSGAADGGIHIYYVSDNPNVSSGLSAAVYPWYFGVFGAKTNSYNLKYDLGYDPCDTCFMDMFIRNDNADLTWINNYSDPATVGCKIHLLGESMDLDPYRSEYITSVALIATAPCNDTMDVDTMDIDTVIIIDPPIDTSAVIDSLCEVLFPNAFTPNNDGLNDTWGGYTPCQVPENYLLQIFNRWGERVFFSNNIDQFWDGTYKGKQQHLESYVWLVSYTIDDSSIQEVGNVTLIR